MAQGYTARQCGIGGSIHRRGGRKGERRRVSCYCRGTLRRCVSVALDCNYSKPHNIFEHMIICAPASRACSPLLWLRLLCQVGAVCMLSVHNQLEMRRCHCVQVTRGGRLVWHPLLGRTQLQSISMAGRVLNGITVVVDALEGGCST